jgi:hypothetical protein
VPAVPAAFTTFTAANRTPEERSEAARKAVQARSRRPS